MLKRLTRSLLMMGLVAAVLASPATDADAQIDTGGYLINAFKDDVGSAVHPVSGASTPIGRIVVPTRPVDSPRYVEEWSFFEDELSYAFAPESVVEIVPFRTGDAPPPADAETARRAITRLELSADELDVAPDDPGIYHTASIHRSTAPTCHVKEIWQCASCDADSERQGMVPVGAIRQTVNADGVFAEQEWLLSAGYIYPSPANGIITQLRPSARPCSPLALDGLNVVRTIYVRISSAETLPAHDSARDDRPPLGAGPALGCALEPRRDAGTPAWPPALSLHVVAALLLIRRRARDRQR